MDSSNNTCEMKIHTRRHCIGTPEWYIWAARTPDIIGGIVCFGHNKKNMVTPDLAYSFPLVNKDGSNLFGQLST